MNCSRGTGSGPNGKAVSVLIQLQLFIYVKFIQFVFISSLLEAGLSRWSILFAVDLPFLSYSTRSPLLIQIFFPDLLSFHQ
jgi:hypothetical protein